MESHTFILTAICKQSILFMIKSETLAGTRSAKQNAIARQVTDQTCGEVNRADLLYIWFFLYDRNSGFIVTV